MSDCGCGVPMDAVGKGGITPTDIQRLVRHFYDVVRADSKLGPIFHQHVGTEDAAWAAHIGKIERFWANVMLQARVYDGNPMQTHMRLPGIGAAHFDRWLNLFETAAYETMPLQKAEVFTTLARRIGRSLQMGLERVGPGGVPKITG